MKPSEAARLAKSLVGQFANLRPGDPDVFVASLAAVLAQYPAGVAQDACDPRIGYARTVEFVSIKSLTEWCDRRQSFYQGLASYVPPAPALPSRSYTEEEMQRGRDAMAGLRHSLMAGASIEEMGRLTIDRAAEIGRQQRERRA